MKENALLNKITEKLSLIKKISVTYQVLIPLIILEAIVLKLGSESIFSNPDDALKVIIIVSVITCAFFILTFNMFVKRPLIKIISVINRLADGDLTAKAETISSGEIKDMENYLNTMTDKLNELVGMIVKNSSLLAASSEEFSATSKESVQGASEQTTNIDEAYQSIQQFHEAINVITENFESANKEAKDATDATTQGQEIIIKAMEYMEHTSEAVTKAAEKVNELGKSSKQIGNITAVIREITNKTNLLALNAAIEAARAGEHGLGFAVVADEVRKLAERTTMATKEIESTIQNIQSATESVVQLMQKTTEEVSQSAGLVQETGASLKQINQKTTNVSNEITNIVSSLEAQKESTDLIITDIEKASNVAQGFTIGAMEASKASNELSKMASELETVVHSFKISEK